MEVENGRSKKAVRRQVFECNGGLSVDAEENIRGSRDYRGQQAEVRRCTTTTHYAGGCTGHCKESELEELPSTIGAIEGKIDGESKWDRDAYVIEESGGMKDDGEKPRWELLPVEPIEDLVRILTFGARKYEKNNWMKVSPDRYVGALYRHLTAWQKGEDNDPDSGYHHLAHALCNVMFLLWLERYSETSNCS